MEHQHFCRILVATDFSGHADAALAEGVRLARLCGAEVTLAHVIRDVRTAVEAMPYDARWALVAGDIDEFQRSLRRDADERLLQLTDGHRASGVTFHRETLLGTPFAALIHAVQQEGHDLLVAGARGASGLKGLLVGSTTAKLVRKCPCPVWVAKAGTPGKVWDGPGSILVPTDFSPVSSKALAVGAALASEVDGTVHVLHVFDTEDLPDVSSRALAADPKAVYRARRLMRRAAMERLDEFVKPLASGPRHTLHVAQGVPWKVIVASARRFDAGVVVMGNIARHGVGGLLIGNTAEKVLRACDRSILTLKPAGFISPVQPAFWSLHPAEQPVQTGVS
jgi:universal stress protein E